MIKQRKIELLAPAKNLECGMAAIDHGADAVYIGAPKFGARAAAVNSLEDIAALVEYAHLYNVRIYVTVNTILKDEELKETEEMIRPCTVSEWMRLLCRIWESPVWSCRPFRCMRARRWITVRQRK